MKKKQYFDFKYPFTNDFMEKYEFDLNNNQRERVASDLLHLIFTPKGQRLRLPDYGTNLIQYIFEPNDESIWPEVKQEIQDTVRKWIYGVDLNDIQVMASEDGTEIYVRVDYSVTEGNLTSNNSIAVQI